MKKHIREREQSEKLGLRLTNFKILPDQIGRFVFPGGLHARYWKLDPNVGTLIQRNKDLSDAINVRNEILEKIVSRCEDLEELVEKDDQKGQQGLPNDQSERKLTRAAQKQQKERIDRTSRFHQVSRRDICYVTEH